MVSNEHYNKKIYLIDVINKEIFYDKNTCNNFHPRQ